MTKINHWLYGVKEYTILIEKETECHKCVHEEVCEKYMDERCSNYTFGTSQYDITTCFSCSNRYTRFDKKQPIPCFHCKNFKDKTKFERIEKLNSLK